MAYRLAAAIGAETVLRGLIGSPASLIALLEQDLWLLPMTKAHREALSVADAAEPDGFDSAPAGFGAVAAAASKPGPLAYVEAEFFGGVGTQAAQVWEGGRVALGPLLLDEGEQFPPEGTPISRALRRLGVVKGERFDEFDAAGLGRHRHTEKWLSPPR